MMSTRAHHLTIYKFKNPRTVSKAKGRSELKGFENSSQLPRNFGLDKRVLRGRVGSAKTREHSSLDLILLCGKDQKNFGNRVQRAYLNLVIFFLIASL